MKSIFLSALMVGILVGCSTHDKYPKRTPSSTEDVGVIGPDGGVALYYREGNSIIIKACEPYILMGLTPSQARSNCRGKINKVPVESFKQALRDLVSIDRMDILKPLTPEEVEAYVRGGPTSEQIEIMVAELEKINRFIATYGEDSANLVRKEELLKALLSQKTRIRALEKLKAEIEKVIGLITDQTKVTLITSSTDDEKFLYTAVQRFNPNQTAPCGLRGSVDERIKDCSYQRTSNRGNFVLVTRSKAFKEVYKDLSSGLLWSDRLVGTTQHGGALKACRGDLNEVAGLSKFEWKLPSIENYKEADKNGIRKALPNMNDTFWSSSVRFYISNLMWFYDGEHGSVKYTHSFSELSVRCIAREQ